LYLGLHEEVVHSAQKGCEEGGIGTEGAAQDHICSMLTKASSLRVYPPLGT